LTPFALAASRVAREGVVGLDADLGRSLDPEGVSENAGKPAGFFETAFNETFLAVRACFDLRESGPTEGGRLRFRGGEENRREFTDALRSSCFRAAKVSEEAEEASEVWESLFAVGVARPVLDGITGRIVNRSRGVSSS